MIYLVLLSRTQCHGVLLFITIGFFLHRQGRGPTDMNVCTIFHIVLFFFFFSLRWSLSCLAEIRGAISLAI